MKITYSEPVVSEAVVHENDDSNVWGPGWHAERRQDGCALSFLVAAHGGGEMTVSIDEEEFEALRRDPGQFLAVARQHGG